MLWNCDLVIVGAGPVGCVLAERAANVMGWTCLVLEKRPHVGGNCFDFVHQSGVRLHRYGPHLFRTWNKSLVDYLSEYTEWIPGNYRVQAFHSGEFYPLPINLTTLEKFFKRPLTQDSAQDLLRTRRIPNANPQNSEEYVLSQVGRELYEAFYLGYTQKQWGLHPRELCSSVCGRIPVRFNRDDAYVQETYRLMPKHGYARLFEGMLRHPLISVQLETDYFNVRDILRPRIAMVYSGPVDAYFDYRFGTLG